MAADSVAIFS